MLNLNYKPFLLASMISIFGMSAQAAENAAPHADLEQVAAIDQPIGNMTFTADDRKIFSVHPFYKLPLRVAELTSASTYKPFPNESWNAPQGNSTQHFDDVLGVRTDSEGLVWILDMGTRTAQTPKLVVWNLKTDSLERIYFIPAPASLPTSQLNDFVVDRKHGHVYIADEEVGFGGDGSRGALVDVDIKTGACRRLLEGDKSAKAELVPVVVNGKTLQVDDKKTGRKRLLTIGNDGIAADKDYEWLYFGPMNGSSLYRVRIDSLLDQTLTDKQLASAVERYSDKTNNGGISVDNDGNIYSTEPEHRAIGIITAKDHKYSRYATHEKLTWPDGVSFGADGYVYVSDSQIDKSPLCNDGKSLNKPPYLLFRFKPLAPGRVGQ